MTSTQTSTASAKKSVSALATIAQHMARIGAAPIPRNYELFYEALSGHKPELLKELAALGPDTSQAELDSLGVRFRLVGQNAIAAEKTRLDTTEALTGLSDRLSMMIDRKQGYTETLEKLAGAGKSKAGDGALDAVMLKTLLADMLLQEKNAMLLLKSGIVQLEKLRTGVDAERRVNIIDRLTGLPNKAAFSSRMTALFESDAPRHRSVLMLVELTSLRTLTARMGPELANRILRRFGVILRKSVKKNDFVARIGDQEFALLFDDVTSEMVRSIAFRLYDTVEDKLLPRRGEEPKPNLVGMASGIAGCDDATSAGEYFGKAETALLTARKQAEPRIGTYAKPVAKKTKGN